MLGSMGGREFHSKGNLLKKKWRLVVVDEYVCISLRADWERVGMEGECSEI